MKKIGGWGGGALNEIRRGWGKLLVFAEDEVFHEGGGGSRWGLEKEFFNQIRP